jgi:hypothetical protein
VPPGQGEDPALEYPSRELDTSQAHPARVYDYWLGGKDNFAADREAAQRAIDANPLIVPGVRANRAFLGRAVRYLVDAGIRQFLDIGTGIPAANNTHEVAQAADPSCRVVYVDNDPIVMAHAQALLTSAAEGRTDYIEADLREPQVILARAAATLDFDKPVAVTLLAILQNVPDDARPNDLVATLMAAVPAGSYLVVSHPASDIVPEAMAEMGRRLNERQGPQDQVTFRSYDEVARLFGDLDLAPPGIVQPHRWRPLPSDLAYRGDLTAWCGVARKP